MKNKGGDRPASAGEDLGFRRGFKVADGDGGDHGLGAGRFQSF